MANTTYDIFESSVFQEGIYTGYSCAKIHHVDLLNKRIYLNPSVTEYHPVDDIYRELKFIRAKDITLRVMQMPVVTQGNIAKGGGKFTPRLAIFRFGWKIVPQDTTHSLYITGEQITDDGQSGPACLDTTLLSPGTNVTIHYEPPTSELIHVTGGSGASAAELWSYNNRSLTQQVSVEPSVIASAVWSHNIRELTNFDIAAIAQAVENILSDNFGNIVVDNAAIAAAVRTNLATELARIDTNISSRIEHGEVVNANTRMINNVSIIGNGTPNDKWRPVGSV